MTFTTHWASNDGSSGSYSVEGPEYEVNWFLSSNDADDHTQQAIAYVQANIADLGDGYSFRNDSYAAAKLWKIGAKKIPDSDDGNRIVWVATLHYRTPQDTDDDGGEPFSPLDLRPSINIRTAQYTRACEAAEYVSGFNGVPHNTLIADPYKGPPVNSALTVYDPPAEVDDDRKVITIRRNLASLTATGVRGNIVNSTGFTISYRGVVQTVNALCGKTRDVDISMQRRNDVDFIAVQFSIDVIESDDVNDTWRLRLLDQGIAALVQPGASDGRGGSISLSDIAPGTATTRRLLDHDDMPITEPVPLDGAGAPQQAQDGITPVFGTWKYYKEDDYTVWGAFAGLLV